MPEINTIDTNKVDESVESFLKAEWCPKQAQNKWLSSLTWDVYDVKLNDWVSVGKPESPGVVDSSVLEALPHIDALQHKPGEVGMDLRPHVYDAVLKQYILIDSGGQVSAFPPEPGDAPRSKVASESRQWH